MNALNPVYILILMFVAFVFSKKSSKRLELPNSDGRYNSIDGLRGYAAFFVFIHHASIWFFYLKDKTWIAPSSHLYNHLGQTSVAFFFMITGFLFSKKILSNRNNNLDWFKLFISRMLRLFPLYIFSVTILVVIAFAFSGWILHEPVAKVFIELLRWYTFTISGSPDINQVEHTSGIIAGVTQGEIMNVF